MASSDTHIHDLPDVIFTNLFALVTDTRARNAMSLVCRKWCELERSTRTSLTLRGNVRDLFLIPTCFPNVTHLDLSLLSPWGYPLLDSPTSPFPVLFASRLAQAFPSLTSLTVYARSPPTLQLLAPQWPSLLHVKLVRWHQRQPFPIASDFQYLFQHCKSLTSLDLSHFYYWTEDLPPALQAHPTVAASLTRLDLLCSSAEGIKSRELLAITAACPNLNQLLASCTFDPRYVDFLGDDRLLTLASNCPHLSLLHLADASALSGVREDPEAVGFAPSDAMISRPTLDDLFASLPLLEELVLDICHNVRDTGPALEILNFRCPRLKSLKLGQFHGICRGVGGQLDGIAICRGLKLLSIKNSADLTDSALLAISRGCPRLAKFEIQGCKEVTETGMKRFSGTLHQTLIDVRISCCKNLNAASSLRALEPIRDRIQCLHIDCVWNEGLEEGSRRVVRDLDLNQSDCEPDEYLQDFNSVERKKCRYSEEAPCCSGSSSSKFWCKTWARLKYLSLWIAVGEFLTPLASAGLESCPELEEIWIRVEGDCRLKPKPTRHAFGLSCLCCYPRLSKMQLDCGEAFGFALTAPPGQMDLSLWERFYLNGIGALTLSELDYWPLQDKDVNQRSLSLPAAGLLAQCSTLRKLFIHGTANEHFMMFLPKIPNIRDVQLREDYYPAPENDMSTEMRMDSCSRFEDALNRRRIPD